MRKITCVSKPTVNSMMKNRNAHNGDTGSLATASGYTTKANPGPERL